MISTFLFRAAACCTVFAALVIWTSGRGDAFPQQDTASPGPPSESEQPAPADTAAPPASAPPAAAPPGSEAVPGAAAADAAPAALPRSEYSPEAKELVEQFEALRDQLAEAIGDLRAIQIRYANGLDQSPQAEQAFRQQRGRAGELLNQTYEKALELIRLAPDRPAATYALTLVQYREANDIYNASTFEGAARLLDAGLNYVYLFRAAARSGVVSGEFETARKIYDSLQDENLEDVDRRLKFQMDQLEREWKAEQEQREKDAAKQLPRVRLHTTRGDAVLELYFEQAPSTVSHFLRLVEEGFYDGLSFYQVVEHLVAVTGDPIGDGRGNAGRFIADEHDRPGARHALRGSLVMAKLPAGSAGQFVPDSASSQFAILYLPMAQTSENQTVFGRVIEGMDVISTLQRVDPSKKKGKGEVVAPPDRILEAEVIRRPETLPEPNYVDPPRAAPAAGPASAPR